MCTIKSIQFPYNHSAGLAVPIAPEVTGAISLRSKWSLRQEFYPDDCDDREWSESIIMKLFLHCFRRLRSLGKRWSESWRFSSLQNSRHIPFTTGQHLDFPSVCLSVSLPPSLPLSPPSLPPPLNSRTNEPVRRLNLIQDRVSVFAFGSLR